MNTLDRYLSREWLKVFLLATLGFPLLVFVIDYADNSDKYLSRSVTTGHLFLSYIFYLPETVTLVIKLGSEFSDTCWASTCVNPTRPDKQDKKKP